MIIELEPSQKIPLTYELADGTLAPTRYIQSKIINFETRAVIKTQNLTDNGSGDFSNYDHTPKSLAITKSKYFEVITTVYKTGAYSTTDELRYATTKQIYYVVEKYGGALLGGRETGWFGSPKINYDKLVKKFFAYNPDKIKNSKSFARRFLSSASKLDIINSNISKVPAILNNKIDELSNDLADVISGIGNRIITDIRTDIGKIDLSSITDNVNGSLEIINDSLGGLSKSIINQGQETNKNIISISKDINDKSDIKRIFDSMIKKINGFEKSIRIIKGYYLVIDNQALSTKINKVDDNFQMLKNEIKRMDKKINSDSKLMEANTNLMSYLDNIEQTLYEMEQNK